MRMGAHLAHEFLSPILAGQPDADRVAGLLIAKKDAKARGNVSLRPLTAIDKERLGPGLAIDRARRRNRHQQDSARRMAGPRVEDVTVPLSTRSKVLLRIAGSGNRRVSEQDRAGITLRFPRAAYPDTPSLLTGRRPEGIDAASTVCHSEDWSR